MYKGKKVVVVMPAYNAAKTLKTTCSELDMLLVDEVVLVDDKSTDDTEAVARALGIKHVIRHDINKGYGGNQKTCYNRALELGGDIIVMLHPDYQYTPKILPAMVALLECGLYDAVFASRILGKGALKGGMPLYKYVANRVLTLTQNVLMNQKLSEYHTGYRAYTRQVLEGVDYSLNSDDFIFDNEIVAQIFAKGYDIAEVTCPTKYFADGSSINFSRSVKYGLGVLYVSWRYFLHKIRVLQWDKLQGKEVAVVSQIA
jgi:glycosyltransferase involved in cell wall biosynthesis